MDAEQRAYLRSLLLREKTRVDHMQGPGITLYGQWAEVIPHTAALIERTLKDLED